MRVLILGIDGYLGWPLAQYLAALGHEVSGIDSGLRRELVGDAGSHSAIPIATMHERAGVLGELLGHDPLIYRDDIAVFYGSVCELLHKFQPDAIVHLAEIPSAPYSMKNSHTARVTMHNNIIGTLNVLFAMRDHCPGAHLVKLGTMGEYGTPNLDIPEGFFEVEYRGRKDTLPFPRQAGSWYHQTKVHDSNNVQFACRVWGLRSTDIMQGVVYGTRIDEMGDDPRLLTRLDFDESFGTAINRFCCMAVVGHPITPFGAGGQRRGFLPLCDSMQCLTLAIENPADEGEYRVFNQFEEVYTINELAAKVVKVAHDLGIPGALVRAIENPRMEAEEHYYNPDHQYLLDLGYQPTHDMEAELCVMLADLMTHRDRIDAKREVLIPEIQWDGRRERVGWL